MAEPQLPPWAKLAPTHTEGGTEIRPGKVPVVEVNAREMVQTWLRELAANPAPFEAFPSKTFTGPDGKAIQVAAMTPEESICDPDSPTQYWLEVAHQCMKLDLQLAMRRFAFEIRLFGDPLKQLKLSRYSPGRGLEAATFGREAREHYRRIRGLLPS